MKGLFSKLAIVAAVAVLFSACGDDKKAEVSCATSSRKQATTQAPVDQNTEAAAPEANAEASEQAPEANAEANTEAAQAPADQNADEAAQAGTEASEQAPKTEEAK